MYGSWDTEWDRIFCHFVPFFALYHPNPPPIPLMIQKIKIFKKNEKNVYHKWRSYDIWFLKYKLWKTEIFIILGHFLSFQPHNNPENQNFKIGKNTWRYYYFTHLHHIWQSYDVWFLRYGAWQTEPGVFPSTLPYHCFCVPNWVCKRLKAFSHAEDMKTSAGSLQSTVRPQ